MAIARAREDWLFLLPARRGDGLCAVAVRHGAFVMGKQITALEAQKRDPERVNVHLDGQFAFGLAAIEATRLRVGQVLSDEDIVRLQRRDAEERAVGRALDLLSYRPRSQAEVGRRLKRKGCEEETVGQALDRLSQVGLLDDLAFARYWVENRSQFNPRGVAVLRRELVQKGVDERFIEQALAEYDEEAAAARAAEGLVRRLSGLDPATFRRRLHDHLARRGFPYAVIDSLIQQLSADRAGEHLEEMEL